jgi:hypothetical protein
MTHTHTVRVLWVTDRPGAETVMLVKLSIYQTQWGSEDKPLAPIDPYMGRTAQLTFRRCILNIYSTNILTEYFKHAA